MAGVNKVILVGHLGKDPEIRALEGGIKVANFTMATTETYKDKNGDKKDVTEWHNVVFWGAIVSVIEKYLKKGSQIYIEGKIRYRSYEGKDGQKKYITEVLGNNMTMLGKKDSGGSSSGQAGGSGNSDEEDLPF
jgi:single-strand DNA-binding protein